MTQTPAPRDPAPHGDPPGVPAGPGEHPWLGSPDWRLVPQSPHWDEAYLAVAADEEDPGDLQEYQDPDNAPPPGLEDAELEALIAEALQIAAGQVRAAQDAARAGQTAVLAAVGAVLAGRRGPGMPGSAESFPGEHASPAAGFAAGQPLDAAPGCATLASFLEDAAGDDGRYAGVSDDELAGVICAWDRVEASASAGKHAAVAEVIRRRPDPGCAVAGRAQMPEGWHEFTGRELGAVLGVSAGDAEDILGLAHNLEVGLPGTRAAFRAGILNHDKAEIIAAAAALLDPAEARTAEAMVLGRAGSLTPAQLRAAIRRAVMEVNPGHAKKRREHMARRTRVERWAEDSGNAGLAGRELPPAGVLAADQRVTAWAQELRTAGLEGDMDQLRARACLDILLGTDSRPPGGAPATRTDSRPHGSGPDRPPGQDTDGGDGSGGRPPGPGQGGSGPGGPRTPAPPRPGGRGHPARVRRPGHPDHPRDHPAPPRRPARRAGRPRPHRPGPGPRPGRRRRPQPPVHLVPDCHRPPGARHRARLRPARTRRRPR